MQATLIGATQYFCKGTLFRKDRPTDIEPDVGGYLRDVTALDKRGNTVPMFKIDDGAPTETEPAQRRRSGPAITAASVA